MWIIVAIGAYFFLAVVAVLDKYLLVGPLPNPKLYAFAIGILGAAAFVLVPFGVVEIPSLHIMGIALGAGFVQTFALVALFTGLKKFEASRIIPAIGGLLPLFTLVFTVVLGQGVLSGVTGIAFALLVGGSVLVSIERSRAFTIQSIYIAGVAALLFSVFVVASKIVYEDQPFLSGLLWIIAGSFVGALVLLVSGELRRDLWNTLQRRGAAKQVLSPLVLFLFVFNQVLSALGFVLQNWAVALAPFAYIAFVNALEGMKYVFVFGLASLLSMVRPSLVQEKLSTKRVVQKLVAIGVIGAGLVLLTV
jgi:drug/metabolite transporter (DMT)-like permease